MSFPRPPRLPFVVAAVACLALLAPGATALAKGRPTKDAQTPAFCQTDQAAGFAGSGGNYCAPTALSDGMIYLTAARDYADLAPVATPAEHAKLIKALAAQMSTDPGAGTGPAQILKGIWGYVTKRGYAVDRLEYAGWRDIGASNAKRYGQGVRPKLAWLRQAAKDPEAVLLVNVGWYRPAAGGWQRRSGHWLNVVGAGAGKQDFLVRNPALPAADQRKKSAIRLAPLDESFVVVSSPGNPKTMDGFYAAAGPALPLAPAYRAVVDCALLFTLKP